MTASWAHAGEDSARVYALQTYDWKGRPLTTTNADGSTVEYRYGGCGCAGGEVVSTRDEVGRRRKVTYDALGRPRETQVFTQQDKGVAFTFSPTGAPYSTVTNTYDALGRTREVRERAEAEGVEQVTTLAYDGHGRLRSRHTPGQDGNVATLYTYNDDDTLDTVTDGRGAVTTPSRWRPGRIVQLRRACRLGRIYKGGSNCFSIINLYVLKVAGRPCRPVTRRPSAVAVKPEVGREIYWTKVSVDIFASSGETGA